MGQTSSEVGTNFALPVITERIEFMKYLSVKEAAEKWEISERIVRK